MAARQIPDYIGDLTKSHMKTAYNIWQANTLSKNPCLTCRKADIPCWVKPEGGLGKRCAKCAALSRSRENCGAADVADPDDVLSDHDDRLDPDSVIVADSETMLRQRLKRKASRELDRDRKISTPGSSITAGNASTVSGLLGQLKGQVDTYETSMSQLMSSSQELNGRFNNFLKELREGLRQRDIVIKEQDGVIEKLNTTIKEQGNTLEGLKGRLSKVKMALAGWDPVVGKAVEP